jgi:hypothetical protein
MLRIARGEDRDDRADALQRHGQVVLDQLAERADLRVEAERLELAAAIILERGLERARHLERDGGRAGDGDDGVLVELDHLVGAIVHDDVARRGAAIAGDEHAVLVWKERTVVAS